MFDLVDGVEAYPQFLPWCGGARMLETHEGGKTARIDIDYHGVRAHFTTDNANRRPESIVVTLKDGPFRHLHGEWRFIALAPDACKIEFELAYEFATHCPRDGSSGPVFNHIANTLHRRIRAPRRSRRERRALVSVTVVYAAEAAQDCVPVSLPAGSTAAEAIRRSGLVARLGPRRRRARDRGARARHRRDTPDSPTAIAIELLRPISADPKEARRRRARRARTRPTSPRRVRRSPKRR